jgi:hypothetical protein
LHGEYTRALTFENRGQQSAQIRTQSAQICTQDREALARGVDVVAVQSASIAQQPNLEIEILERPKSREHAIDLLRSLNPPPIGMSGGCFFQKETQKGAYTAHMYPPPHTIQKETLKGAYKAARAKGAPKRPATSFVMFSNAHRDQVNEE